MRHQQRRLGTCPIESKNPGEDCWGEREKKKFKRGVLWGGEAGRHKRWGCSAVDGRVKEEKGNTHL